MDSLRPVGRLLLDGIGLERRRHVEIHLLCAAPEPIVPPDESRRCVCRRSVEKAGKKAAVKAEIVAKNVAPTSGVTGGGRGGGGGRGKASGRRGRGAAVPVKRAVATVAAVAAVPKRKRAKAPKDGGVGKKARVAGTDQLMGLRRG